MAMSVGYNGNRGHAERDALRLLCSDLIAPDTRARLIAMLDPSSFLDELNRVAFEEIVAIGAVSARRLRELLPGRITLRGFPDFDVKDFLGRNTAQDEDIDRLFESLLELTEESRAENTKALGQSA